MWLVVGLGNPGDKYAKTRHNVGFMVVDAMARNLGASFQGAFNGEMAKTSLDGSPVGLLKPQTFMNRSGESVQPATHFHKIAPSHVIVIHDELDLPFGEVRVKFDGGHGGHNGIRDITRAIGPAFTRIRVGVGRPHIKGLEADYVLGDYKSAEKELLAEQLVTAAEAVSTVIHDGVEKAQMKFNRKNSPLANKA